jgi:hypothetical protein
MNLQNGYKVIYEKAADGKRTFLASKTGFFADAEVITEAEIGKYKLIYERAGRFYGSETGIPAENDFCFEAFDKVFKAAEATENTVAVVANDEEDIPAVQDEPEQVSVEEEELTEDLGEEDEE